MMQRIVGPDPLIKKYYNILDLGLVEDIKRFVYASPHTTIEERRAAFSDRTNAEFSRAMRHIFGYDKKT